MPSVFGIVFLGLFGVIAIFAVEYVPKWLDGLNAPDAGVTVEVHGFTFEIPPGWEDNGIIPVERTEFTSKIGGWIHGTGSQEVAIVYTFTRFHRSPDQIPDRLVRRWVAAETSQESLTNKITCEQEVITNKARQAGTRAHFHRYTPAEAVTINGLKVAKAVGTGKGTTITSTTIRVLWREGNTEFELSAQTKSEPGSKSYRQIEQTIASLRRSTTSQLSSEPESGPTTTEPVTAASPNTPRQQFSGEFVELDHYLLNFPPKYEKELLDGGRAVPTAYGVVRQVTLQRGNESHIRVTHTSYKSPSEIPASERSLPLARASSTRQAIEQLCAMMQKDPEITFEWVVQQPEVVRFGEIEFGRCVFNDRRKELQMEMLLHKPEQAEELRITFVRGKSDQAEKEAIEGILATLRKKK